MSDRDMLIVGPPSPALEYALKHWEANDWNVSVFERSSLTRLANVKALFIQHLKQEGLVLLDDGCFLRTLMDNYSPKSDYRAERNDALSQICSLPDATGNYWHDICLADIVYVLLRNASILHLACMQDYVFQYENLIEKMVDIFGLKSSERGALLSMRTLKHGYRRRVEGLKVSEPLLEARQVINKIFATLPDHSMSSIAIGNTSNEYIKMRSDELNYVTNYSPNFLDALGQESDLFASWQRIRRGGGYDKPKMVIQ